MAAETPAPAPTPNSDTLQYWCYHCEKRVSIETLANVHDVICLECKNGFVEFFPSVSPLPSVSDHPDDAFGSQFLQMLSIFAQAARDEDAPPRPPSTGQEPNPDDDFLRIELDGWDNEEEEEDNDNYNDSDDVNGGGVDGGGGDERSDNDNEDGGDEVGDEDGDGEREIDADVQADEDYAEDLGRRRRDILRLRIRDFATRSSSSRNRILDWAEILMGLEDNSIEFHLEVPESERYIGNPEDYLDAAGYDALLNNLAESENGRRGAPPASKLAVAGLVRVLASSEEEVVVCAICKDGVYVGETETKMPCGHGYHEDCIVTWLGSRNSCPVCRFELATDDVEYEEEKSRRSAVVNHRGASGSGGSGLWVSEVMHYQVM